MKYVIQPKGRLVQKRELFGTITGDAKNRTYRVEWRKKWSFLGFGRDHLIYVWYEQDGIWQLKKLWDFFAEEAAATNFANITSELD